MLNKSASYYTSPSRSPHETERIARLKAKIEEMQLSIEAEKSTRMDRIGEKIDSLDSHVEEVLTQREASVHSLDSDA